MSANWSESQVHGWITRGSPRDPERTALAGIGSERKFRLLMCAAIQRLWLLLLDPRSRRAVEIVQAYADGQATEAELLSAAGHAYEAYTESRAAGHEPALANAAYTAALPCPPCEPHVAALIVLEDCRAACQRNQHLGLDADQEREEHWRLFRCLFGLAFRDQPVDVPRWRSWNGGTVERLARAIYQEQRFGMLPILGDALEEAGCNDAEVLHHCREEIDHVRGCWVVDLLLGYS